MPIGSTLFLRNRGICRGRAGTAAANTGGKRIAKIGRSGCHFLPSNLFLWIDTDFKFCLLIFALGVHQRRVMPLLQPIVNNQLLIVSIP